MNAGGAAAAAAAAATPATAAAAQPSHPHAQPDNLRRHHQQQQQQEQQQQPVPQFPAALPLRRFADTASPSTSTNPTCIPAPAPAAGTAPAGRTAEASGLDGCVQRLPLRLLPLWAFPGTAPGQVLRRGCADRLLVAQGEQPGPLSLGVLLLEWHDKHSVGLPFCTLTGVSSLCMPYSDNKVIPGLKREQSPSVPLVLVSVGYRTYCTHAGVAGRLKFWGMPGGIYARP